MKNYDSGYYFSKLRDAFKENDVSLIGISLGSFQDDSICMEERENKWIVYSVDRGNKCKLKEYDSIKDACYDVIHRSTSSDEEEEKTKAYFDKTVTLKYNMKHRKIHRAIKRIEMRMIAYLIDRSAARLSGMFCAASFKGRKKIIKVNRKTLDDLAVDTPEVFTRSANLPKES